VNRPLREAGLIRIGDLQIDHVRHQVTLGEHPLQLTPSEYRILTVLAERPNQVVSRESLAKLAWADPTKTHSRTIDVHIGRLRIKLTQAGWAAGRNPPPIVAVREFGYKLVGEPTRPPARAQPVPEHRTVQESLAHIVEVLERIEQALLDEHPQNGPTRPG
jgi:DNA-binding response OmpR family regulator